MRSRVNGGDEGELSGAGLAIQGCSTFGGTIPRKVEHPRRTPPSSPPSPAANEPRPCRWALRGVPRPRHEPPRARLRHDAPSAAASRPASTSARLGPPGCARCRATSRPSSARRRRRPSSASTGVDQHDVGVGARRPASPCRPQPVQPAPAPPRRPRRRARTGCGPRRAVEQHGEASCPGPAARSARPRSSRRASAPASTARGRSRCSRCRPSASAAHIASRSCAVRARAGGVNLRKAHVLDHLVLAAASGTAGSSRRTRSARGRSGTSSAPRGGSRAPRPTRAPVRRARRVRPRERHVLGLAACATRARRRRRSRPVARRRASASAVIASSSQWTSAIAPQPATARQSASWSDGSNPGTPCVVHVNALMKAAPAAHTPAISSKRPGHACARQREVDARRGPARTRAFGRGRRRSDHRLRHACARRRSSRPAAAAAAVPAGKSSRLGVGRIHRMDVHVHHPRHHEQARGVDGLARLGISAPRAATFPSRTARFRRALVP